MCFPPPNAYFLLLRPIYLSPFIMVMNWARTLHMRHRNTIILCIISSMIRVLLASSFQWSFHSQLTLCVLTFLPYVLERTRMIEATYHSTPKCHLKMREFFIYDCDNGFFYIQIWQFYNSPCKAFWLLLINVSNCVYNSPRTHTSKLLRFKWCFQSKYCEALASFPCCFPVFASIMKISSGNETIETTLILSCSHLNKQFSFAFIWFDDRISIDFLC